jgi:SAM-dependent methyltransferase
MNPSTDHAGVESNASSCPPTPLIITSEGRIRGEGERVPEFDDYARDYEKLLHDPIRERFAPASKFFFERKWVLLQEHLSSVGLEPGRGRWLDVGCGKGELLQLGAHAFAEVVGCDVSPEMIRSAQCLHVVVQPEPGRLPFPDAHFDLVTAVCVYHHVIPQDRPGLTAEIARVLRPGGYACIIEHNPFNPVTQLIVHRTPVDADAHLLTASTTRRVLVGGGLRHSATTFFLYFPEKLYLRLKAFENALAAIPLGGQYAVFARKS